MTIQRKEKGFTLVEIVLAMTVLALAFTGIWSAYITSLQKSGESEKIVTASFLAREKLEFYIGLKKNKGFNAGDLDTGNFEKVNNVGQREIQEGNLPPPYGQFTRTTTIKFLDENLNEDISDKGYKKISVQVAWGMPAPDKSVTLTTILTNW